MLNCTFATFAFRMLRSDTFNPAIRVKNAPEGIKASFSFNGH